MKTTSASLLLIALLAAEPALAQTQTKPAAKPTAKSAPAKPTATARPATAHPAAARPTAARPTAARPAAKPAPAPRPTAPAAAPSAPAPTASTPVPAAPAEATGELFRKGTTIVNFGIGLGLGYSGYYGTLKSTPALSLSAERGIIEGVGPGTIGVGGLVGYKAYHYDYGMGGYKATWTNLLISVRGTYHYNVLQNPKLDTYAGLSLGVRVQKWKDTYYDSSPYLKGYATSTSYVTSGVFIGARYFLTDNIGAFTEVGYDMNYLKLGLTARF